MATITRCRFCGLATGLVWEPHPEVKSASNKGFLLVETETGQVHKCKTDGGAGFHAGAPVASGFKLSMPKTESAPLPEPDLLWASSITNQVKDAKETAQNAVQTTLAAVAEWTGISQQFEVMKTEAQKQRESYNHALTLINEARPQILVVKTEYTSIEIKERMHKEFARLVKYTLISRRAGKIVFLTGEPGSGKTAAIQYLAKALGDAAGPLPFYTQSMTQLTSISDIEGFISGHGNYVESPLWQVCKPESEGGRGGIVLLDEVDASNANALLGINSYGANEWVTFPNGQTFKKHPKAYIIAAGNTIGSGSDTRFAGRNELDMATRDRFLYLPWNTDWALVAEICRGIIGNDDWARKVKIIHDIVERRKIEWVVSARLAFAGCHMLLDGFSEADILDSMLWVHLSADQRRVVELDMVNADIGPDKPIDGIDFDGNGSYPSGSKILKAIW